MKCKIIILVSILSAFTLLAQPEKNVESKITNVTVFLSRAQVTREAKSHIETGKTFLVFTGLTAQLDPESIQVKGRGNFTILGISHRQNYLNELNMPQSLKALKDSVESLQRQIFLEQGQKESLTKEEQMLLANQKIGGVNQNIMVAELKAMADFYRSRLNEIINSRLKQDDKLKKLNNRMAKIQLQINEQNELYARNTSEIVVSVSAEIASNVEMEINYVVANAGWYPVYDLRALNTKSPIQLNYKANVFQGTGEEWKNVRLKLSTANPNQGGLKPELSAWYLDFYEPMIVAQEYNKRSKSKVMPSARYDADTKKSEEKMPAAEVVADYVQTIQTTLNTEFDIALPYTVASSSKYTTVDIRNYDMKADYIYSAAPKLDPDAFLIAQARDWEDFNLLAGEANIFFEGTFVGKTFIDPNNTKDTLSVSLGRDKRIVVKREKLKDFTSRNLIGSNKKELYAYEITVRNTKSEPIKITLEDQIPVTMNSQIEVSLVDMGGAKFTKDTGKLLWELNLLPNETKKVSFKYEVKYPKDKRVSGL
jgi:uncharacterized protein (TIGR02231 family)